MVRDCHRRTDAKKEGASEDATFQLAQQSHAVWDLIAKIVKGDTNHKNLDPPVIFHPPEKGACFIGLTSALSGNEKVQILSRVVEGISNLSQMKKEIQALRNRKKVQLAMVDGLNCIDWPDCQDKFAAYCRPDIIAQWAPILAKKRKGDFPESWHKFVRTIAGKVPVGPTDTGMCTDYVVDKNRYTFLCANVDSIVETLVDLPSKQFGKFWKLL